MANIETKLYNREGKEKETISLPENIFGLEWNGDLVHQVVTAMRANETRPTSHTKDRSEVSGGGKKPWAQKGTGNARHGSRRSPIWVAGGIAHGPRNEKNTSKKINKKVRHKALFTALSQKLRDGQMLFTERLTMDAIATKDAVAVVNGLTNVTGFETLATPNPVNMLLVLPAHDESIEKSFRNLPFCTVEDIHNLNPRQVLQYRYIVFTSPEDCVAFLESKIAKKVTA